MLELAFFLVFIFIAGYFIMNSRNFKTGSFELEESKILEDVLIKENIKPTEFQIENTLGSNKYKLYKRLCNKFNTIGTPDLFWRGQQN